MREFLQNISNEVVFNCFIVKNPLRTGCVKRCIVGNLTRECFLFPVGPVSVEHSREPVFPVQPVLKQRLGGSRRVRDAGGSVNSAGRTAGRWRRRTTICSNCC